jgi:hypothetical protein
MPPQSWRVDGNGSRQPSITLPPAMTVNPTTPARQADHTGAAVHEQPQVSDLKYPRACAHPQHSPTARTFHHREVVRGGIFCAVARWDNGQTVRRAPCGGLAVLMKQIWPWRLTPSRVWREGLAHRELKRGMAGAEVNDVAAGMASRDLLISC